MYLLLILIFAFSLRLISLNQSLWLDEGSTALAAGLSLPDLFSKFLPGDFHPPLYYVVMHYWVSLFGSSEIALRIPSVIFGIGSVYLTFRISERILSKKVGFLSAILLSTSGLSIYYSQEARMYSLVVFLVVIAIYFFVIKKYILFSIALALIGLTDYIALFIVPIFFVLHYKNKKIWFSMIPLIFTFLLWAPVFYKQLSGGVSVRDISPLWWNVLGSLNLKNILLIPVKFMIGRISLENDTFYALLVIALSIVFGYLLYLARKSKMLIWLWLVVPFLLGLIVSIKIPVLSYFRYIFTLPAFYILVASGIERINIKYRKFVLLIVILVNMVSSLIYLVNDKFHREDWRGLVDLIEKNRADNSQLIFQSGGNTEAYRYYEPNAKIAGPAGLKTGYEEVWVVRYLKDIFDPENDTIRFVEHLGYIKSSEYVIRNLEVWKYEQK